ncbi:sensor histidine kinase [Cryptosporangium sp. NPDC048952]|uniref:sensor histidine kinase n=1 Tax=Cryptosporangium sp. NPDC048952 TaxID=3363961 RepID=UPI003713F7C3
MSRSRVGDLLAVAAAATLAVLLAVGMLRPFGGVTVLAHVLLAVPLLWRRRAPVVVAWIAVAAAVVIALGGDVLVSPGLSRQSYPWAPAIAPFAVYAATAYGGRRGLVPTTALTLVASHFWALSNDSPWVIQSLVFVGVPALLGLYVGARRRLIDSLIERSERAERERHLLAEQARAEERSRLAAEMHDLVTHRVSLMVLQAGALSLTSAEGPTRAAAEEIRATGSQAMDELRDLIGILQVVPDGAVAEAPAPGTLVTLVDESGVSAELVEDGNADQLSPVVSRAAYRVVQEALTNIRKHAPGAEASVRVRYRPDGVSVSVSVTNGPAASAPDPVLVGSGSGVGLRGLRQRVELLDGTLTASAHAQGFTVEAHLPAYVAR